MHIEGDPRSPRLVRVVNSNADMAGTTRYKKTLNIWLLSRAKIAAPDFFKRIVVILNFYVASCAYLVKISCFMGKVSQASDPGVKKASNPGSESATLVTVRLIFKNVTSASSI